ncbi:MAG: RDD family protein [Vicinamibacteria bacterium]
MTCPACREAVPPGQDSCPACGAALGAPVEGALAPDLSRIAQDKIEPLRAIPGLRRREPTWKDEVRERVRHRRKKRGAEAEPELPIFDEAEAASTPPVAPAVELGEASEIDSGRELLLDQSRARASEFGTGAGEPADVLDLPLRRTGAPEPVAPREREPLDLPLASERKPSRFEPPVLEPRPLAWAAAEDPEAEPELPGLLEPARPLERPASPGERLQAASIDLALLLAIDLVVLYFAGRAARVPLTALGPALGWLAGFCALVALLYAAFFTSACGATIGKMLLGLRVVDRSGDRLDFKRSLARAALGSLGTAALLGALPMFFDPARRALHDRLLRSRVVRF